MANSSLHNLNAASSMNSTDELYLVISPFTTSDDRRISFSNFQNSITALGTLTGLTVSGSSSLAGLTTSGAVSVGTTLAVTGASSFTGDVVANHNLTVNNNLNVNNNANFLGAVSFSGSTAFGAITVTSINKVAITAPATSATLTIADGKTLTVNNSLTLAGTDATTMTFPTTSATIARTDAGQTFTGVQSMTSPDITTSLTTPSATFSLVNATATTINFGGAATAINMGGGSGCIVKLGGGANAAELRFLEPSAGGTNFTSFKAQAQAADLTYTLPAAQGAASTFLQNDGSGGLTWAAGSSGGMSVTSVVVSTNFAPSTRFTDTVTNGSVTYNANGSIIDSSATSTSYAKQRYSICALGGGSGGAIFANSPVFSIYLGVDSNWGTTNSQEAIACLGNITVAGAGITLTNSHIGFYLVREAGVNNLYGSVADGATNTKTAVLTTFAANDVFELVAVVTSNTNVAFYWAKNGGTFSSATNVTTNIPTANDEYATFAASNHATTGRAGLNMGSFCWRRR